MPTRLQDASREISIHALREEGDVVLAFASTLPGCNFYPRPPRGGRPCKSESFLRFPIANFYPRPPRGGRRRELVQADVHFLISIHALREEGDPFHLL